MPTSPDRRALLALLATLLVPRGAAASGPESITARGILPGSPMVLLAEVHSCGEKKPPAAQVFTSSDEGKTWVRRGPSIEGARFEYVAATPQGVWVAGLHVVEGPGADPFVLVPGDVSSGWTLHPIFEGPAELRGIARRRPGELVAWIKHIDASDERWRGPVYRHASGDDGRTWAGGRRSSAPAARSPGAFSKVSRVGKAWRVVDRTDGGFDVQRRAGKTWGTVAQFPWRPCD